MRRSRTFPETTASVHMARQFIADAVNELVPEVCDMAALLVSELATNAVVHAESAFDVAIVHPSPSGRLRVEVSDRDRVQPMPRHPPPNVPHGRGLLLVSTLADAWGIQEASRRAGKTIWFELAPRARRGRSGH